MNSHILNLVREHVQPFLTLRDMASMLFTDKNMKSVVANKVAEAPDSYKAIFKLMKIMRRPIHQLRNSTLSVMFLGDVTLFEDVDGLRPRDRIYSNAFSVTARASSKNNKTLRFKQADYVSKFLDEKAELVDHKTIDKHDWATMFDSDITDIIVTHTGCYQDDIENMVKSLKELMTLSNFDVHTINIQVSKSELNDFDITY